MKKPAAVTALFVLALAAAGGCNAPLPAATPPAPSAIDARVVQRGAELAAVGNCRTCHTRRDGAGYAGGVPMHSPFGTIHSTNITPDLETGIGGWSLEAFRRAMREGVRDDGQHLYPAFPYDRFTRTTDEDIAAIYAYLMTVPPVRYEPPSNRLMFPFNIRAGIAIWKRLHLKEGPRPTASRGEYLVEGLGHCGSCHSPRTKTYGEDLKRVYDGGEAEGWHAYAINEKNGAPIPWDAKSLAFYLRHGYHQHHGIARGTMGIVAYELGDAAPADIEAMGQYVAALMKEPSAARVARASKLLKDPGTTVKSTDESAAIYDAICRGCHSGRREPPWDGLALTLSMGVSGESPRNLVNVILHGIPPPPDGSTGPTMPGYMGALSDAQVEKLVRWLRANLSDRPPWPHDLPKMIAEARRMTPDMLLYPPGGTGAKP